MGHALWIMLSDPTSSVLIRFRELTSVIGSVRSFGASIDVRSVQSRIRASA